MKAFRTVLPLANWLLRLALVVMLFTLYFNTVVDLDFGRLGFYLASLFILFGVLLIGGGFTKDPGLTVVSGLIIFLLSLYQLVVNFSGNIDYELAVHFMNLSLGFYFFARGNKN